MVTHECLGESVSALLVDATGAIAQSAPFTIQSRSESMRHASARGVITDARGHLLDDDCTLI